MTDDAFGFGASKRETTAAKLRQIKPSSRETGIESIARIDAAGAAHGFLPREAATASPRRRREIGPTIAINMRAPERVALPFIQWCEAQRYSYWEGLEAMMQKVGISAFDAEP